MAGDRGDIRIANTRSRLRTRVAFEQQSAGGLTSLLLRHAVGHSAWPDVDSIAAVSDERVAALAARMLDGATFWQIIEAGSARWSNGDEPEP